MSNSLAEAYLLIVRESNVPIIGEAVPVPFTGQIELDAWTWDLKNREHLTKQHTRDRLDNEARAKKREAKEKKEKAKKEAQAAKSRTDTRLRTPSIQPEALIRRVDLLQQNSGKDQKWRDEEVKKLIKKAVIEYKEIAEEASEDKDDDAEHDDSDPEDRKMKLTFEKGADLATTPLLYALARGDLIPKAVLTLFHRAKTTPVTLVITMSDVRITKYTVSCEAGDYMSDVKETWEATYESVDWMYQNRPDAKGPNGVTKGTVRVFKMGSDFSANSPI